MLKILSLLSILIWTSSVFAGDVLVISGGKFYLLEVEDGVPVLKQVLSSVDQIIHMDEGGFPGPDEPPAETEFGLVAQTKNWIKTLPENTRETQKKLSVALKDTATAAASGKFQNTQELEASLGAVLGSILTDRKTWDSFGSSFQASIDAFKKSGKIKSVGDYGRAILEVSKGLQ